MTYSIQIHFNHFRLDIYTYFMSAILRESMKLCMFNVENFNIGCVLYINPKTSL